MNFHIILIFAVSVLICTAILGSQLISDRELSLAIGSTRGSIKVNSVHAFDVGYSCASRFILQETKYAGRCTPFSWGQMTTQEMLRSLEVGYDSSNTDVVNFWTSIRTRFPHHKKDSDESFIKNRTSRMKQFLLRIQASEPLIFVCAALDGHGGLETNEFPLLRGKLRNLRKHTTRENTKFVLCSNYKASLGKKYECADTKFVFVKNNDRNWDVWKSTVYPIVNTMCTEFIT